MKTPAGTPPWGIELIKEIERAMRIARDAPAKMPVFAKANLPDAGKYKDCWIKVSDETGGDTAAESDGTNWRRMQDRAIVS